MEKTKKHSRRKSAHFFSEKRAKDKRPPLPSLPLTASCFASVDLTIDESALPISPCTSIGFTWTPRVLQVITKASLIRGEDVLEKQHTAAYFSNTLRKAINKDACDLNQEIGEKIASAAGEPFFL